jgi:phosphoglycolate phosphatase
MAYCVDLVLAEMGRTPAGQSLVRRWVGDGVERLLARALAHGRETPGDDLAETAHAVSLFSSFYASRLCQSSRVYPGVMAGLDTLRNSGVRLACVTNKPGRFTEPLLHAVGLRAHLDVVVAGDTIAYRKPDPRPLLHAVDLLGAPVSRTLLVGDSLNDVKGGRAAGIAVACVSYGYNHGIDIREARPDAVVDSLEELPRLFDTGG